VALSAMLAGGHVPDAASKIRKGVIDPDLYLV
jgi:hypothetical protein